MSRSETYKVLVVDDEESILRFAQHTLSQDSSIKTLIAHNTNYADEIIRSEEIDLVLIDLYFANTETDGLDFVRAIRQSGYNKLICMYTGSKSPKKLFEAALAGADDYITKGSSINLLNETRRLLSRSRQTNPLEQEVDPITEGAFLRSLGLDKSQTKLLSEFASLGYPRIKELASQLGISETSIWKRISRIKNKLNLDSLTQITYLLSAISALGQVSRHSKGSS